MRRSRSLTASTGPNAARAVLVPSPSEPVSFEPAARSTPSAPTNSSTRSADEPSTTAVMHAGRIRHVGGGGGAEAELAVAVLAPGEADLAARDGERDVAAGADAHDIERAALHRRARGREPAGAELAGGIAAPAPDGAVVAQHDHVVVARGDRGHARDAADVDWRQRRESRAVTELADAVEAPGADAAVVEQGDGEIAAGRDRHRRARQGDLGRRGARGLVGEAELARRRCGPRHRRRRSHSAAAHGSCPPPPSRRSRRGQRDGARRVATRSGGGAVAALAVDVEAPGGDRAVAAPDDGERLGGGRAARGREVGERGGRRGDRGGDAFSVATAEVALPRALVTVTENCAPLSTAAIAGVT